MEPAVAFATAMRPSIYSAGERLATHIVCCGSWLCESDKIEDALRAANSTWQTRTALIDGASEEQTRRRWTFEELLTESEKVARELLLSFQRGPPRHPASFWTGRRGLTSHSLEALSAVSQVARKRMEN